MIKPKYLQMYTSANVALVTHIAVEESERALPTGFLLLNANLSLLVICKKKLWMKAL